MQLSVQDLLSISAMPEDEQLSLQTLALFYEEHLCHKQYYYEVRHKVEKIRLRFKPGDLCHLLGIHHIKGGYPNSGERGFNAMKNGLLTLEDLQAANIADYEDMRYRILYFPFVYQLIQNPQIVIHDQQNTHIVKAQFVFYDKYGARYVELKLRQERQDDPHFFVPVTFGTWRKVKPRTQVYIKAINEVEYNEAYQK